VEKTVIVKAVYLVQDIVAWLWEKRGLVVRIKVIIGYVDGIGSIGIEYTPFLFAQYLRNERES
jgi:hypothetical protein